MQPSLPRPDLNIRTLGTMQTLKNHTRKQISNPSPYLEVRRSINIPTSRVVIILQSALERICCSSRRNTVALLVSCASTSESHQSIIVIVGLLAAPDSPCYDEETG